MIRFIKRIVYCFVGLLTFLLLMYLVAFCVGEPELNKDRYIKSFIKVLITIVDNMFL